MTKLAEIKVPKEIRLRSEAQVKRALSRTLKDIEYTRAIPKEQQGPFFHHIVMLLRAKARTLVWMLGGEWPRI